MVLPRLLVGVTNKIRAFKCGVLLPIVMLLVVAGLKK